MSVLLTASLAWDAYSISVPFAYRIFGSHASYYDMARASGKYRYSVHGERYSRTFGGFSLFRAFFDWLVLRCWVSQRWSKARLGSWQLSKKFTPLAQWVRLCQIWWESIYRKVNLTSNEEQNHRLSAASMSFWSAVAPMFNAQFKVQTIIYALTTIQRLIYTAKSEDSAQAWCAGEFYFDKEVKAGPTSPNLASRVRAGLVSALRPTMISA